jgi:hypothetical protein
VQRGANLDDGAGLAGQVSADAPGKGSFRGVACSPEAKPAPSGANGNTVDRYRLKPLQRGVVRPIRESGAESQNGNPG